MTFLRQRLTSLLQCAALCILSFAIVPAQAQEAQAQETHGINVADMDRSQKPGDNWFLYCNGDWIKRTEIPPDRAGMGVFSRASRRSRQANCGHH